ncbi:alpha/beta hydrolase [Daejeonella sp.]|uniref:alpha/beta hydrolase n=1 Tax=Daejeonella sp. TaxID=2805397 RepID=UPI0030C54C4D
MFRYIMFLILPPMLISRSSAQTVIPLYTGKIPNSIGAPDIEKSDTSKTSGRIGIQKISNPTLRVYLPAKEKATGAAIVICPGGGYSGLAITHEGYEVAAEFNKIGVAAFVLKYRLPNDRIMVSKETGPLQDAQEAIKMVRKHAKKWNIDANKVGIMGFSAGGHLASTAGTHFTIAVTENKDNINLRPDFMMLIYPVISFSDSLTHKGSRDNLLGQTPSGEKKMHYSAELQVNGQTPPVFLVHAQDDKTVKVGNSIKLYESLTKNGIPAEMHLYPKGGHGFGLINKTSNDLWMQHLKNWMIAGNWIKP